MKSSLSFAIVAATLFSKVYTHPTTKSGDLVVKTSSGSIQGFIDSKFQNVVQFLGVPYAAAPIGSLRFMPPQAYSSKKLFNATKSPNACPQYTATAPNIWSFSTPQFLNSNPWSEDCLSVSVHVPSCTIDGNKKLPVFIWLHGGGLVSGSASVPYQQPQPWIQRSQQHIVVEVQYRLGIFGFPNAAGLHDNNLGILDQRLAIEWVRDNIAAFGGDTERIILWGQSAGSASIDAQNFAFPHDPIAAGFIQDSGTALVPVGNGLGLFTLDPTHSNFTFVANHFNCPSTPPFQQLKCMRTIPANRIISFLSSYANNATTPPLFFIGTPDERTIFSNYTSRYLLGAFSDRPAIIGSNTMEGQLIAPFPPKPHLQGPNSTLSHQITLSLFQCPAGNSAGLREAKSRKTYRYIYAGNFSDVSPVFWEGAYHAVELPLIFGTRGEFGREASEFEVRTSEAMQDLWLGFAENSGDPLGVGWREAETQFMLMFGAEGGPAVRVINESVVDLPCKRAGLGLG